VIAISLAPLVQSLAENQMQFQLNVVGLKMRNGLMAAIYRKCLRLRWAGDAAATPAAAQQEVPVCQYGKEAWQRQHGAC
jgi:hypothetical protein